MSIRRPLLLGVVLSLGLFLISLDAHSDQNTATSVTTGTSMEGQTEAKPADSADSSGKIEAVAKIAVVEPVFKFDPVLDGETINHTFVIKNTGTAELKILKVRTD